MKRPACSAGAPARAAVRVAAAPARAALRFAAAPVLAMLRLAAAPTLAALLVVAAPAHAGILAPQDAAELAQTLAEAQDDQGVCYGWNVTNNFSDTPDVGSSTGGPGVALVPVQRSCPRGAVVLVGDIDYSCDSCEASDSASVGISSSLRDPPTVEDLEGLGLDAGALTGEDDDTTLVNMVNALPLLVADRGNAPYVAYEPATTVPAADRATDKPGSDLLRDSWLGLLFFGALVLAGPGFLLYKRSQLAKPAASSPPGEPPAGSPPPPAEPGGVRSTPAPSHSTPAPSPATPPPPSTPPPSPST